MSSAAFAKALFGDPWHRFLHCANIADMCGIAGIFSFNGEAPARALIERITRTLSHRGPDGEGYFCSNSVALGHRRLSIIDIACGAQPMHSFDGRFAITFNGEIFNYLELREELVALGRTFITSSDTEVLLQALQQWGNEALSKVNGQFAFALYNKETRTLTLARDAMGEKPLYYLVTKDSLVFASEVKAIVEYCRATNEKLTLSPFSVSAYLALNYVPFDGSFLQGVQGLEPGSWLEVPSRRVRKGRFVAKPHAMHNPSSPLDEFSFLAPRAASLRLRSDVPVGLFLSGGIDSSVVASALQGTSNLKAFIADFSLPGFSEARAAREVCAHLGFAAEIVPMQLEKEDIPRLIEQLVFHGDAPLADSSSLPVYLLSRATAQSVKVALSGDGGDELFGGYLTYDATLLAARIPKPLRTLLSLAAPLMQMLPKSEVKVGLREKLERFTRALSLPPGAAHFAWNGMFQAKEKAQLLRPDVLKNAARHETFLQLAQALEVSLGAPTLRSVMIADQRSYLSNDILVKTDRMSMAHGLEVRPVFMDPAIVSLSRNLPDEWLIQGNQKKVLLRKYLAQKAPWYDVRRPKQGFSIPIHHWYRTILKDFAAEIFSPRSVEYSQVFEPLAVEKLWQAHLTRTRDLGFELWGIMVAILWLRKFS